VNGKLNILWKEVVVAECKVPFRYLV